MPIDPTPSVPPATLPRFDPRTAQVIGIDTHLPAVRAAVLQPEALRARFRSPPAWEPEVWPEARLQVRPPARASVLVGLVMRDRPTVLLTERTTHLSTHSGQVAFPGGKQDDTDRDVIHTALREAHEEVGLSPDDVEILGTLPIHRTGTQFIITPVVGLVRAGHSLTLNAHEVADAFEVPLEFLMNPAHHHRHLVHLDDAERRFLSMPYMEGSTERFIWGATASMLRNLYRFLAA